MNSGENMLEHKAIIEAEVKALSAGEGEEENPNGEFEVVLSAPSVDLDGEMVMPKAFEPLPDYIPIDIDHGLKVTSLIGSGKPYYDGDVLKLKGTFASTPLGQEARTLVREGHLRSASVVMWKPERDMKSIPPRVMKAQLLIATLAPIGKNRDALMLSAKAYTDAEDVARTETKALINEVLDEREKKAPLNAWVSADGVTTNMTTGATYSLFDNVASDADTKAGARNNRNDIQRIQSVHDHAVDLGAECKGAAKALEGETETVVTKAVSAEDTAPVGGDKPSPDEVEDEAAAKALADAEALELMRMELELL
jgi:hypothetical protein